MLLFLGGTTKLVNRSLRRKQVCSLVFSIRQASFRKLRLGRKLPSLRMTPQFFMYKNHINFSSVSHPERILLASLLRDDSSNHYANLYRYIFRDNLVIKRTNQTNSPKEDSSARSNRSFFHGASALIAFLSRAHLSGYRTFHNIPID